MHMHARTSRASRKARIPLVDRLDYFLRSRASKVVVLALVANTMVAQLLYNSAGQLVLGNAFVVGLSAHLGGVLAPSPSPSSRSARSSNCTT